LSNKHRAKAKPELINGTVLIRFTTCTLALVVDARFGGRAILITAAAKNTSSADACLFYLTLRMRDARYHALVVNTLLSVRAIGDRTAHG